MKPVSDDIKWFCDQLQQAEQILSNAIERTKEFSEGDKRIVGRIISDIEMIDLTLVQLLSPKSPK